jgi:hypothetical protein
VFGKCKQTTRFSLMTCVSHKSSSMHLHRLFGQFLTYPLDVVRRRMQVALATDGKVPTLRYVHRTAFLSSVLSMRCALLVVGCTLLLLMAHCDSTFLLLT